MRKAYHAAWVIGIMAFLGACAPNNADAPDDAQAQTSQGEGYCNDLSGSWEMVSVTVTTQDSTFTEFAANIPTLKILNDTHWMFIRQSSDEFLFAQGGHYTLVDGEYTEIVDYSAEPNNIGLSYSFECELVGDSLWYHKGDLFSMHIDEIWQRADQDEHAPAE